RNIEQKSAEKKEAAEPLVQQHGVFAEPAKAGAPGEVALQQRRRIDDGTAVASRHFFLHPVAELPETPAQYAVIVGALGVARDLARVVRSLRERQLVSRSETATIQPTSVVIQRHHDYAF